MQVDWTVFAVSLFAFWERSELFSLHKKHFSAERTHDYILLVPEVDGHPVCAMPVWGSDGREGNSAWLRSGGCPVRMLSFCCA